jgi:hypothetical protein
MLVMLYEMLETYICERWRLMFVFELVCCGDIYEIHGLCEICDLYVIYVMYM